MYKFECPYCGFSNPETAFYCGEGLSWGCGAPLRPNEPNLDPRQDFVIRGRITALSTREIELYPNAILIITLMSHKEMLGHARVEFAERLVRMGDGSRYVDYEFERPSHELVARALSDAAKALGWELSVMLVFNDRYLGDLCERENKKYDIAVPLLHR